jgi:hypothetical protein
MHGSTIELDLRPSQERQLESQSNLNNIFYEEAYVKEFYKQAKKGKFLTDDQEKQKIMLKYYLNVHQNHELPLPHFSKKPSFV